MRRKQLFHWLLFTAIFWVANFNNASASVDGRMQWQVEIPPDYCQELLLNGSFDMPNVGWNLFDSQHPPAYQSDITRPESKYSLILGHADPRQPIGESTSVIEQDVSLPPDVDYIMLYFYYYPILYEDDPGQGDLQYMQINHAMTEQFTERPLTTLRNDRRWLYLKHDLTPLAGQKIRLRFGVNNDGEAGRTAMYVDDVSVHACGVKGEIRNANTQSNAAASTTARPAPATPTWTVTPIPQPTWTPVPPTVNPPPLPATSTYPPSPTPYPTPTPYVVYNGPTPTALPFPPTPLPRPQKPTPLPVEGVPPASGCDTPLKNRSFEEGYAHWHIGEDPIPPSLTSDEIYSGSASMVLGNGHQADKVSFSSIRQLVQLPHNASSITLYWQALYRSEESYDPQPAAYYDHQELILLDTNLNTVAVVHRVRRNDGVWVSEYADLTKYQGRTLYLYFNVYNDGNGYRSWMYLDYLDLQVCYPVYSTPIPTHLVATSTPIPTTVAPTTQPATDTPLPAATMTFTPSSTPLPTNTSPPPATMTFTPSVTPFPTNTPPPSPTSTFIPTLTHTPQPAVTSTPLPSNTPLPIPTDTPSQPTLIPTVTQLLTRPPLSQAGPSLSFTATAQIRSPATIAVSIETLVAISQPTYTSEPLQILSTPPAVEIPAQGSNQGFNWRISLNNLLNSLWTEQLGVIAILLSILAIIGLIGWLLWRIIFKR